VERGSSIPLGEVTLFVRRLGAGDGIPLLVIHGGPDWDHTYLLPGLEGIAQARPVVAFDMRGCGRSSVGLEAAAYQPELVVADVKRLIDDLGHAQVDVLGFSTGGQVAQLLVESHPAAVRHLVLASTTAYADVDKHLLGWEEYDCRTTLLPPWPKWAGFDRAHPTTKVHETISWAVEGAPTAIWKLDRLDAYLALLGGVRFTGEWIGPFRRGLLHPWRPADPGAVLRAFPGKVLILHGAQDMGFPVALAERLSDEVPRAELRVLQNAGHMAHFDQPEAWADAVTGFLTGAGG
jgi:pimeloyl-ACP methyl ester carboxylesterase